jgi:tetratricopeptide (TPR) repeat protein
MKFKKIEKSLTTAHTDFYDTLIALDPLAYADGSTSGKDLDSIVKKMSLVTQLHKKSKWTPNCYFLMGKAYYYKKDYQSARATFEYVTANYKDKRYDGVKKIGSVAVKDPAPGKPPYVKGKASLFTFLKHNPFVNESKLWLVKSYLAQADYTDAESLLTYLQEQKDFPYNLRGEQELLFTDLYLKQNKFDYAEESLENTILLTGNGKLRARFAFVLAQLYEENNDPAKAVAAYKSVLKASPTQQMEFYTRIKLAELDESIHSEPAKQIISDLKGMAGDKRFFDERDVIYYTIAEVELKENDGSDAMTYLQESIKKSVSNDQQKGLSFLQIGELNFADENYQQAKMNYDSALSFLDKKYPKLPEVQSRSKILTNLDNQFTIIQNEDSLQELAAMSDKDRDKVLDEAVKKLNKHIADTSGDDESDDAENMDAGINNLNDENSDNEDATASGGASASTFYFYNQSLKGSGFNTFVQQWGNRKLEDNWRRSNKNTNANSLTGANGTAGDSTAKGEVVAAGAITKDMLLKNVPLTADQLKKSNEKIADAFFTLGIIYKDDLGNNAKAIETFEKLNTKFPDYTRQAEVDYYLYLLYTLQKNTAKADQYKQLILTQFPKSDYALTINHSYQATVAATDQVSSYYASTYDYFNKQNYQLVLQRATAADSLYKGNALLPKFALLRAISTGKLAANNDTLKIALQNFLKIYTTGPEAQSARAMLNALASSKNINLKDTATSRSIAATQKPGNSQTNVQPAKQIVNPDADEDDNSNDTASNDNGTDSTAVASGVIAQKTDTSSSGSNASQKNDSSATSSTSQQNAIHAETSSTAYQSPRLTGTHYVVIATENLGTKLTSPNPVHDSVSAFDKKFYKNNYLFTTTQPLNAQVNLLVIKSFINSTNAQKYLAQMQDHPFMKQADANGQIPVIFCIDASNFGLLIQTKDINGYLGFYNQNYH